MKKNRLKLGILALGTGLIVTFCAPPKEMEKTTFLAKNVINLEDTTTTGKIEGDAHGGKYFSRADSANIYGAGISFNVPDSLLQKDIRVKINVWVRIGDLGADKKYAFSLEEPGTGAVSNWQQVDFRSHVAEANKWINVTDSVTIPGNFVNKAGLIIKTYSFNPEGKSTLDCDDIELSFYKVEKVMEK